MATVVDVETAKPKVTGATLKLTTSDLQDMRTFIEEWYIRNARYSKFSENTTYKAVTDALAGKTSSAPAPF